MIFWINGMMLLTERVTKSVKDFIKKRLLGETVLVLWASYT